MLKEKVIEIFTELDQPTWFDQYRLDNDDPKSDENARKALECHQYLLSLFDKIFIVIHESLLKGEYISDNFSVEIDLLIKELQSKYEIPNVEFPNPLEENFLAYYFKNGIIKELGNFLSQYYTFSELVNRQIRRYYIDHFSFIQTDELLNSSKSPNKFTQLVRDQVDLLNIHLDLCKFDHNLDKTANQEENLIQIFKYFNKLQEELKLIHGEVSVKILYKCSYLGYKLVIRNLRNNPEPLLYLKGRYHDSVTVDKFKDIIQGENCSYTSIHYKFLPEHTWRSELGEFKNKLCNSYNTLKVQYIIKLIRYFLKVDPSFESLSEIYNVLQEKFISFNGRQEAFELFDRKAHAICLNYCANCLLSLAITSKNENSEIIIEQAYEKVMTVQRLTQIKNFYPHEKYLRYLLNRMELLTEFDENTKHGTKLDIQSVEKYMQKAKVVLNNYLKSKEWSIKYLGFIIQLPFEECILTFKGQEIFIASSYFSAIDQKQINHSLDSLEREFDRIHAKFIVSKDRAKVYSLIERIGQADVRSMEILAMFSAMVAFVIGSVNITVSVRSAYEAALFSSSLALSLGLFVFMIIGLHRNGVAKIKEHWWLIVLVGFILVTFFVLLLAYENHNVSLSGIIQLIKNTIIL